VSTDFVDLTDAANNPPVVGGGDLEPLVISGTTHTVVVSNLNRLLVFTGNGVTVTVPSTLAEEAAEAGVLSSKFRALFQGTGTHTINAYNGVSEAYSQDAVVWAELIGNDTEGWYLKEFGGGGAGAVTSVNGQTGVVVLDADDIDDSTTTNKFTNASDISKLAGIEALADVTDKVNISAAITITADTSTVIDLSNVLGNYCNMGSANATTTYTLTGTVSGGNARVLINAASEPVITGATNIEGSVFVISTNMYMVVFNNGTATQFWFENI
jgi:hypothetical protein